MSLKENVKMVQEELNSEEKFFEKAVITEKFVKKYKKVMIVSVILIAFLVAANIFYNIKEENRIHTANEALARLESNPNDAQALKELKTSAPALHDVWVYSQAVTKSDRELLQTLQNSQTLIVRDLAKYEFASDALSLENYASKQDAIFRDLALVQGATLLLRENKIQEARNKLSKISQDSSLNKLVSVLMHYGIE